jgi:hypothetical protein
MFYIQFTIFCTKMGQKWSKMEQILLFNTDDNLILYDDVALYKIILIYNFFRQKLQKNYEV